MATLRARGWLLRGWLLACWSAGSRGSPCSCWRSSPTSSSASRRPGRPRPAGRGDRGHDGPQGVGPELAATSTTAICGPRCSTTTKYGGRGLGASDTGPAEQKLDRDPWLKRIFAGYAFALDYRDRRGHFYALFDQEADPARDRAAAARRLPALPRLEPRPLSLRREGRRPEGLRAGLGHALQRGADDEGRQGAAARAASGLVRRLPRSEDHGACASPGRASSPASRRSRPRQGIADYDPNRDATRQEMRSFVCGQCHVEYYFKGPGKVVTYPWANGLKVEEIEAYYDAGGLHGLGPRGDRQQGAEGAASGVRGVEPGRARPRGRGLRGLPHALRARRRD